MTHLSDPSDGPPTAPTLSSMGLADLFCALEMEDLEEMSKQAMLVAHALELMINDHLWTWRHG